MEKNGNFRKDLELSATDSDIVNKVRIGVVVQSIDRDGDQCIMR